MTAEAGSLRALAVQSQWLGQAARRKRTLVIAEVSVLLSAVVNIVPWACLCQYVTCSPYLHPA